MREQDMTRRLFLRRAGSAVGVFAFLPLLPNVARAGSRYDYYEHTILAMGTTARLGVYARSAREADQVINKAFAELKRLESLMSVFDSSSELSQINANAGLQPLAVSADTFEVIWRAKEFSGITNGAFDITVEPLMRLWGFRNATNSLKQLPTNDEVQAALAYVGSHHILLDESARSVGLAKSGCQLDLGGIAVGYALDKMWSILMAEGITDAFLDISGDIIALGVPENGEGWNVAIPDPNGSGELMYQTILKNSALATSGNYMNFVVYEAKQYGHIMDPREGRSANRILSSTAIANKGLTVDALSTASFVQGAPFGTDTKFVLVGSSGAVTVS